MSRKKRTKVANWVSITKFQKLKGIDNERRAILPDAVKLNIVDEDARKAKILELKELKGHRNAKDIDELNQWYNASINQLIEIFKTLAAIAEIFYLQKVRVQRETRLRAKTFDVYHNGYVNKAHEGLINPEIAKHLERKAIAEQRK